MKAVVIGVAAALAFAGSAQANVPMPPKPVTVIRDYCPGGQGVACTLPDGTTIYLAPFLTGDDLAHELGHAFDFQVLTEAEHVQFARIFGRTYDAATYWADAGNDNDLAEWFAEGYRLCRRYPHYRGIASVNELSYNYHPTRVQQRHVCALIRYAAAR